MRCALLDARFIGVNFSKLTHNKNKLKNIFVCNHYHLCKLSSQTIECRIFTLSNSSYCSSIPVNLLWFDHRCTLGASSSYFTGPRVEFTLPRVCWDARLVVESYPFPPGPRKHFSTLPWSQKRPTSHVHRKNFCVPMEWSTVEECFVSSYKLNAQ